MRRIVSALGLSKDRQSRHDRRRAAAPRPTRSLRSESTPALVNLPDSASSSGIRTPSDVEGPDLLSVPAIVNSPSSDSVAHSVKSAPTPSRWAGLLRTLSLKKQERVVPVIDVDDGSSDSQSSTSDRPRSPPALLPPPTPQFASNGRRMSSPASSICRAGMSHVQRRGPPSRANLALREFTQPLVLAAGAPTPHPLRAPDPSSPQCFPRSVSHGVPSQSLCIQLHRARVLQRLEEGALTPAEETSIAPFGVRPPAPRSLRRTRPSPTEEWVAHLELGARTGRWSRGLRRWVARPVFEDRMRVYTPAGTEIVQPARGLGAEMLDFSDGTLAMAGLAIDTETDQTEDDYAPRRNSTSPTPTPLPRSGDSMATQFSPNTHLGATSAEPRTLGAGSHIKPKPTIVRGVRFADDDDATDGDDLPLAVLASVQKKRAEREARARHARHVENVQATQDVGDRRRRSYAEEFARSRALQGNARAGMERPSSFAQSSDTRRMMLPTLGLTPVKEAAFTPGHSRSGSSGSGSSGQRRRSLLVEGMEQVTSPTRSMFLHSGSSSAPTTALPSPASPFATLPRSLPASTRGSPAPLASPTLPFANRSINGSPLRTSFALGTNQEEFGAMLSAVQQNSSPDIRTLMAQNQALMAQNQMLASMMGQNMMELGLPNPPFAHSGGSSASGSRGRSPAGSSAGGSQGSTKRPGPSPVQGQRDSRRASVGPGAAPRGRQMEARDKGESSRSRTRDDSRAGRSKPQSSNRPGHAHSKSEHSISAQRLSKLGTSVVAPPVPSVPTGVYSMRGRPRPAGGVVT
ncbi:unnamed protein product [Rhizoctonia solani]|uniref:Uncharacterized protein n=1 Tax=Rhizoctonia solani TaxID=456999 RepID=A0A8H2XJN6_9AGAM|nr:unnamed protein product [Rhizoctonia solani]